MRLIIIDDNTATQTNGVVTTMREVKKELLGRGISIQHTTPDSFITVPAGVYPGAKLVLNPRRLRELIDEFDATHLHICTEGSLGLYARWFFKSQNWRYTTSVHTRWDLYLKNATGIDPKWGLRYMRWFHKHSAASLVNTESMHQELKSKGWNNLVTWTRGVDQRLFEFRDHPPGARPRVLCVGRISGEKNLDAFCQLDATLYDLICVGDGPQLATLKTQYPHVTFLGELHGQPLAQQYQQADCFVFPSKSDTFGLVMIESMSTGTAVAAYPVPGPQDVVEQGVTGFLAQDLGVAVEQCLRLSRKTVHQGSQKWSWSNTADIFLNTLVPK
jgi:glycosyltransferase involved in cell wall biosynthesis